MKVLANAIARVGVGLLVRVLVLVLLDLLVLVHVRAGVVVVVLVGWKGRKWSRQWAMMACQEVTYSFQACSFQVC